MTVLLAATLTTAAVGQTWFRPSDELPVTQPPKKVEAINVPHMLLGEARRYVGSVFYPQVNNQQRIVTSIDGLSWTEFPMAWWPGTLAGGAVLTRPIATSPDGEVVVGEAAFAGPPYSKHRVAIWSGTAGPVQLQIGTNWYQRPVAASRDCRRILVRTGTGNTARAFLWVEGVVREVTPVPDDPEVEIIADCMSADGTACGGRAGGGSGPGFVWTVTAGGELLDGVPSVSHPQFVSSNAGRVICFGGRTRSGGLWRQIEQESRFLSDDGTIALGSRDSAATLWSPTLGTVTVADELAARGIDTRGWGLKSADHLSVDGRFMVGRGSAPGSTELRWWVARIDPIAPADVGKQGGQPRGDGVLDANDLVVYINRFFAGDERADVGKQGGVAGPDGTFDNNDFVVFLNQFFGPVP